MRKTLFIFVLLSVALTAFGQREKDLPLRSNSYATDTIRVLQNGSSIMLRSVLQSAIYDSLTAHTDTLQLHQDQIAVLSLANDSTWISITTDTIHYSGDKLNVDGDLGVHGRITIDSTLFLKKDLVKVLPDTIIMDNYLRSNGRNHFDFSYGNSYVDASSSAFNRIHTRFDTLTLGYANKMFIYQLDNIVLKADSSYGGWMRLYDNNITMEDQFENNFATQPLFAWRNDLYIGPKDNDTIKFSKGVLGRYDAVRLGTGGGTNNRIDIPQLTIAKLQTSVDDRSVIDTLTMFDINPVNLGMPVDSLSKYYGILHRSTTADIEGINATYFLYSEYGNNFLKDSLFLPDTPELKTAKSLYFNPITGLVSYGDTVIGGTGSLSFGSQYEIPYTNATTDDFDYTSNLTYDGTKLTLGGGSYLDQYENHVLVGSDILTNNRTDATAKTGGFLSPHYTNAEEPLLVIDGFTNLANNQVYIGGGNANYNTATRTRFFAAANTTTTTGTKVVDVDISGIAVDTIRELTASNGLVLKDELYLPNIGGSGTGTSILNYNRTTGEVTYADETLGDVYKVGTPVNNQVGVWTGDGTIEGDGNLTWGGKWLTVGTPGSDGNGVIIGDVSASDNAWLEGFYSGSYATIRHNLWSATTGPVITRFNRYGGSFASPAAAASNSEVDQKSYYVYDGTSLVSSGEHTFKVDGAISTGNFNTEYIWLLKEGASAIAEKMSLDVNGLHVTESIFVEDANTEIFKDGSNNMSFTDAVSGTVSLASLVAGSTNYWQRTGTRLSPLNSGDSIIIATGEAILFGDGTSAIFEGGPGNGINFDADGLGVNSFRMTGTINTSYVPMRIDSIYNAGIDGVYIENININENAIIQPMISASLTDGAPTDAEIDSATGTTPAAAGAGWKRLILDTSGSALIYIVISDGTNWQYTALTIAL